MMKELRQIIEANPVFRGKLKYPSIKSHRLHKLINQSVKDPRPNPVIKTLFVDHVCEPQENVPLPQPIENNLGDCLSLSLSTRNSLKVKSTVTDPGQSHLTAVAIPNLEPGGVGDIGLWDVSSGKKLLSRNFRVWNLDAGPMALKGLHMQSALCNYILIMEATTIGMDGKIKIWLYDSFEGSAVPNWHIVLMFKAKEGNNQSQERPSRDYMSLN
ncbi:unnamed protein product [Prunus armeniaca]